MLQYVRSLATRAAQIAKRHGLLASDSVPDTREDSNTKVQRSACGPRRVQTEVQERTPTASLHDEVVPVARIREVRTVQVQELEQQRRTLLNDYAARARTNTGMSGSRHATMPPEVKREVDRISAQLRALLDKGGLQAMHAELDGMQVNPSSTRLEGERDTMHPDLNRVLDALRRRGSAAGHTTLTAFIAAGPESWYKDPDLCTPCALLPESITARVAWHPLVRDEASQQPEGVSAEAAYEEAQAASVAQRAAALQELKDFVDDAVQARWGAECWDKAYAAYNYGWTGPKCLDLPVLTNITQAALDNVGVSTTAELDDFTTRHITASRRNTKAKWEGRVQSGHPAHSSMQEFFGSCTNKLPLLVQIFLHRLRFGLLPDTDLQQLEDMWGLNPRIIIGAAWDDYAERASQLKERLEQAAAPLSRLKKGVQDAKNRSARALAIQKTAGASPSSSSPALQHRAVHGVSTLQQLDNQLHDTGRSGLMQLAVVAALSLSRRRTAPTVVSVKDMIRRPTFEAIKALELGNVGELEVAEAAVALWARNAIHIVGVTTLEEAGAWAAARGAKSKAFSAAEGLVEAYKTGKLAEFYRAHSPREAAADSDQQQTPCEPDDSDEEVLHVSARHEDTVLQELEDSDDDEGVGAVDQHVLQVAAEEIEAQLAVSAQPLVIQTQGKQANPELGVLAGDWHGLKASIKTNTAFHCSPKGSAMAPLRVRV
eukprot:jgi/Chlat1/2929/Chrsp2S04639